MDQLAFCYAQLHNAAIASISTEVAEIVPFILKGILIIEQAGDGWLVLRIFKIEAKYEYQGRRLWVFI